MDPHGFLWVPMGSHEVAIVSMIPYGIPWKLSWVPVESHGNSRVNPWDSTGSPETYRSSACALAIDLTTYYKFTIPLMGITSHMGSHDIPPDAGRKVPVGHHGKLRGKSHRISWWIPWEGVRCHGTATGSHGIP